VTATRISAPRRILFLVTYQCNQRCTLCPYWADECSDHGLPSDMADRELRTEEALSLVDEMAAMGVAELWVSGGEPFTRRDLPVILRHANSKGISISVNTNLTAIPVEALLTQSLGAVDELDISFNGMETVRAANIANEQREATVLERIRYLVSRRDEKKHKARILVKCTICRDNQDDLLSLYERVESLGVDGMAFQHLSFLTESLYQQHLACLSAAGLEDCGSWASFSRGLHEMMPTRLPEVHRQLETIRSRSHRAGIWFCVHPQLAAADLHRYYSEEDFCAFTGCTWPTHGLTIDPFGNVSVCGWPHLGNVRDKRLCDMWRSKVLQDFQQGLRRERLYPACLRCCLDYESKRY